MTVNELIEKLRKFPSDAEILTWNDEFHVGMGVLDVKFQKWTEPFTGKRESGVVIR